jgi:hypothetical protein
MPVDYKEKPPTPGQIVMVQAGLSSGLDTRRDTAFISPDFVVKAENLVAKDTELRKSPGTIAFGDDSAAFDLEPVLTVDRFTTSPGTQWLWGASQTKFGYWDPSTDAWADLTTTAPTGAANSYWTSATAFSDTAPGALTANLRYLVVANGQDELFAWDGDTGNDFEKITAAPITKYVAWFNNRILCLYTTEGGTAYPNRLRWCQSGDITKWSGRGAGAVDIAEIPGVATGVAVLAGKAYVFFEDGIATVHATRTSALPFAITPTPGKGTGCWAPRTLTPTPGGYHIFLARDLNVYAFNGEKKPQPIGQQIQPELTNDLDRSAVDDCHASYNPEENTYYLFIPIKGDNRTYPTRCYTLDLNTGAWTRRTYPKGVISASNSGIKTGVTIQALVPNIDDLEGTIDELTGEAQPERTIFSIDTRSQDNGLYGLGRIQAQSKATFVNPTDFLERQTAWLTGTIGSGFGHNAAWKNGPPDHRTNFEQLDGVLAEDEYATGTPSISLATGVSCRFETTGWGIPGTAVLTGLQIRLTGATRNTTGGDTTVWCELGNGIIGDPPGAFNGAFTARALATLPSTTVQGTAIVGGALSTWNSALPPLLGPTTVTTNAIDLVCYRGQDPSPTTFGRDIKLDSFEHRWTYQDAVVPEGAGPIACSFTTPDLDFQAPLFNKTLQEIVVWYRDVSSTSDPIIITTLNNGQKFTAHTAGLNDNKIKSVRVTPFQTTATFQIKVEHTNPTDIVFLGYELHALVAGNRGFE